MRKRPERPSLLVPVILLAVALTLAVSGGAGARSTFQSTPLQFGTETPTPLPDVPIITNTPTPFVQAPAVTDTPTPFGLPPDVTDTPTPFAEQPFGTETPDPALAQQQVPAAPPPATEPPGGPGFLPAPTLTNPDDFLPGSGSLPQPAPAPLTGPAVSAESDAVEPAPAPDVPGAAQLIDSGIRALSYLWLCCGAVVILVAVLLFVWLTRRTRR